MTFEEFLRTIPMIRRHIMRTRRLKHENTLFRNYLESVNSDIDEILTGDLDTKDILTIVSTSGETIDEPLFNRLKRALENETHTRKQLEQENYILRQDNHKLLGKIGVGDTVLENQPSQK